MLLHNKVLRTLIQEKLFRKGTTVLVGVSGGIDSVVLLHILNSIRCALSIRLYVVHYNHKLRRTSDRDQRYVIKLSKQFNIPIIIGENVNKKPTITSEDQARKLRFDFFSKAMKKSNAELLMLAHNQNDQAETILMRIIRGAGLYGMRGIKKANLVNGITVLRPLISISRDDIEFYAKINSLSFCHDETNDTDIYLRNKIRRNLIPSLQKEYNARILKSICHLATSIGDDYEVLTELALLKMNRNILRSASGIKINISFFLKTHIAIIRMGVRNIFEELTGSLNQLTYEHVQKVIEHALYAKIGKEFIWLKGIRIQKTDKYIEFKL